MEKTCSKCGGLKPFSAFRKKLDKLTSACAECLAATDKAYREGRSQEKVAQQRERKNEWLAANPGYKANSSRAYVERNPERHKESQREWYAKNKAYFSEKSKRWAEANPEKWREIMRKSEAKMLKENPLFALTKRCRALVGRVIKVAGFTKKSRTHEILGCDWPTLKAHMEAQFVEGMSWENRHLWHIDHIVPMATAVTESDVLSLNRYTNLQPLWAAENLAKKDKLDWVRNGNTQTKIARENDSRGACL